MIRISLPLRSCLGLLSAALVASASAQLARKEADLGNDPAWIKKAAGEIDKRIGTGFQKAKVTATAPADDSRWLRRVYLDATGRIPSYPEAKAFLDDSTPDKREKLVEKLLNSEGYVSQMYN